MNSLSPKIERKRKGSGTRKTTTSIDPDLVRAEAWAMVNNVDQHFRRISLQEEEEAAAAAAAESSSSVADQNDNNPLEQILIKPISTLIHNIDSTTKKLPSKMIAEVTLTTTV